MINNHDPAVYEKKTAKTGTNRSLRPVHGKVDENDLALAVAGDLGISPDFVKYISDQYLRRMVDYFLHDYEVSFRYFGRFRLKRGHKHWLVQFLRKKTLSEYINSRLDNTDNQKTIQKINPSVVDTWYDHVTLTVNDGELKNIR